MARATPLSIHWDIAGTLIDADVRISTLIGAEIEGKVTRVDTYKVNVNGHDLSFPRALYLNGETAMPIEWGAIKRIDHM